MDLIWVQHSKRIIAPVVDDEGKEAYKDDMYGSGAVLSEASSVALARPKQN